MFDDPGRELARLQEKLLETDEPPLEELYEDNTDETLDEIREILRQSDWDEEERPPLYRSYSHEPESSNVYELLEEEQPAKQKRAEKNSPGGGTAFFCVTNHTKVGEVIKCCVWLSWSCLVLIY